jgi:hypothetical protein
MEFDLKRLEKCGFSKPKFTNKLQFKKYLKYGAHKKQFDIDFYISDFDLRFYLDGNIFQRPFIPKSQQELENEINRVHEFMTGKRLNFEDKQLSPYKGHEERIKELEEQNKDLEIRLKNIESFINHNT